MVANSDRQSNPGIGARNDTGAANVVGAEEEPDPTRKSAFRDAKRDAGIPLTQHPDGVKSDVPLLDKNNKQIRDENGVDVTTREYTYTAPDGEKRIIQEHSLGHQFGEGG
jgi:hypothetical protein